MKITECPLCNKPLAWMCYDTSPGAKFDVYCEVHPEAPLRASVPETCEFTCSGRRNDAGEPVFFVERPN